MVTSIGSAGTSATPTVAAASGGGQLATLQRQLVTRQKELAEAQKDTSETGQKEAQQIQLQIQALQQRIAQMQAQVAQQAAQQAAQRQATQEGAANSTEAVKAGGATMLGATGPGSIVDTYA